MGQRGCGGGTRKRSGKLAAAHPMGHHLAPQRLDIALGCTAGDERIQEMSPTPIEIQTESIPTQQQLPLSGAISSKVYNVFLQRPGSRKKIKKKSVRGALSCYFPFHIKPSK